MRMKKGLVNPIKNIPVVLMCQIAMIVKQGYNGAFLKECDIV